jgi:fido (protein-threonine AMPylation protein)
MAGDFELRTKYQFLGLIEKRDRWDALKNDPSAQHRFEHLTGLQWARHNCALDDRVEPELWHRETLDEERTLQVARHLEASRWLIHHSRSKNTLPSSDLLETHRLMMRGIDANAGKYRESEIKPLGEGHEPIEPELVPYVADNALEWFSSESFHEMHEVEKTALVLIKFIDIWPFEEGNGRTLRLFSNFFLLKAGYPPAVIPSDRARQYAVAIQNSLRFHTQPLIDLLTDSVGQGLQYCLGEAVPSPSLPVLQ